MTDYTLIPVALTCRPEYEGQKQVVCCVGWRYEATADKQTATMQGETTVAYVKEEPFIPYEKLKPDDVLAWVLSTWGEDGVAQRRSVLDIDLDRMIHPQTEVLPLPWE
jgi:hypothetical protein